MPDMTEPMAAAPHCLPACPDLDRFSEAMATRGWLVIDRFVDDDLVHRMRADLDLAYATCRRLQVANGIALDTEGTLHHLVGQGESFLEFIDRLGPIVPHLETHFGGRFILNSFGGNILRASASYASAIHRDVRTYSRDLPLLLNTLLMLDDFTVRNGATMMMTGSHRDCPDRPCRQPARVRFEPLARRGREHDVRRAALGHADVQPPAGEAAVRSSARARLRADGHPVRTAATGARVLLAHSRDARGVVPAAAAPDVPTRAGMTR